MINIDTDKGKETRTPNTRSEWLSDKPRLSIHASLLRLSTMVQHINRQTLTKTQRAHRSKRVKGALIA
ncbi:hypothetical protein AACH06_25580 [Ideonella sp. DXS29W]|uniref:Uncharacterized protein n=1 Tax=Ideonella lacteola TaxID=2984193 RepID=A0ABU9BW57_9BURK